MILHPDNELLSLKQEHEDDWEEWEALKFEYGRCSCGPSPPPCGMCVHPGNHIGLMDHEDAWESSLLAAVREVVTAPARL